VQPSGFPVGLLDPLDDARRVGRVFQLDGNYSLHRELFDGLKVGGEFDDAAPGRKVPVDFAIAVADMDMDGLLSEEMNLGGRTQGRN
jgi:hypothetical protein